MKDFALRNRSLPLGSRLGSLARRTAFRGIDLIRGRPVYRHLEDLTSCSSGGISQDDRLENIISHARRTVPFYRKQSYGSFLDLPVLQKADYKKNPDDFLSRSAGLEQAELVFATTSGSYGTPFSFPLTKDKKNRQRAEVIHFNSWAGYRLGDRYAYAKIRRQPLGVRAVLQNEVNLDPSRLTSEVLGGHIKAILAAKPSLLVGYASALVALGAAFRSTGALEQGVYLKGIISSSETLPESAAEELASTFECPVLGRYSTEELGVLAHQCSTNSAFHINSASYLLEVLAPDSNERVSVGQLGRVVVTDFFSHALPLIRYDTGDLAVLGDGCPCGFSGPSLQRVEGRVLETIQSADGRAFTGYVVSGSLRDIPGIQQFQFIQKQPGVFEILIVRLSDFDGEDSIRSRLENALGPGNRLSFRYVKEIPPLRSGKRPYVTVERS